MGPVEAGLYPTAIPHPPAYGVTAVQDLGDPTDRRDPLLGLSNLGVVLALSEQLGEREVADRWLLGIQQPVQGLLRGHGATMAFRSIALHDVPCMRSTTAYRTFCEPALAVKCPAIHGTAAS